MSYFNNGVLILTPDIQTGQSNVSSGVWRVVVNSSDNLVFQKLVGRTWTTKYTISG